MMWSTRHGDLRCSDFIDIPGVAEFDVSWQSLAGIPAATFCAYDSDRNCYLATLNEPSSMRGTIWSLNSDGKVRWQVSSLLPSLSSLAIDNAGQLYFDDGHHIVCLDSLGNTLWRHRSIAETAAAVILADGNIFVQNIAGQISIYTPDGKVLVGGYEIDCEPMQHGCEHDHMPNRFGRMLFTKSAEYIGVSKQYSETMINRFFGVGISAKHVPAIVPETQRVILVMAHGDESGCVYGLDIAVDHESETPEASITIGFSTKIKGGSDTSPAVSFDGERVYCTDGLGHCYCLSTLTGEILWSLLLPDKSSASPSVAPDGFVYFSVKSHIVAIKDHGTSGEIVWQQRCESVNRFSADFQVVANSVLALSQRYVYSVVSVGKPFFNKLLPRSSYLVVLDRYSGEISGSIELAHESLCTLSIMPDGSVLIPSKPLLYGLSRVSRYLRYLLFDFENRDTQFYGLVKLSPAVSMKAH